MKELILGGVRSGKSRLAQQRALRCGLPVIYIATALASDDVELQQRIARHREHRPSSWRVVEAPIALGQALREHADAGHCVLVECLTLWLTNLLCIDEADCLERERRALLEALPALRADIILVSNETGLGVVPLGALSRRFVDISGELHQVLASLCDRVTLAVAGLPHLLKGIDA